MLFMTIYFIDSSKEGTLLEGVVLMVDVGVVFAVSIGADKIC